MKTNKVKMSFTVWALNFDSRDSLLVSLDGNVAHSVYFDNCDTYNILGEPIPFKSGNVCKKEVEVSQNVHLKSWLHVKIMKELSPPSSCSNIGEIVADMNLPSYTAWRTSFATN